VERAWLQRGKHRDGTHPRIREKIEINPKNPKYLKVVWDLDTRWKRRNKASFGRMAAFALDCDEPVLAFVICPNFSGAMGILLLLLSCAVCIGCTVFLFVRTGRVQGSDDIFLGESGALPTEVLAAVILFTPLLGMALGLSLGAVDVVIAGIGTAGGGVMLLCLLALARKWKAGRLIADSLLARVGQRFAGRARFAGARAEHPQGENLSTSLSAWPCVGLLVFCGLCGSWPGLWCFPISFSAISFWA
jgi:hypothetical protein